MARTLIKEALDAAWDAASQVYHQGGTNLEQLKAGIRAYLDFVSDRNRHRREEKKRQEENDNEA